MKRIEKEEPKKPFPLTSEQLRQGEVYETHAGNVYIAIMHKGGVGIVSLSNGVMKCEAHNLAGITFRHLPNAAFTTGE